MKKLIIIVITLLVVQCIPSFAQTFESRKLSMDEIRRLEVYTKFYGYVRHFNNNTYLDSINWHKFLEEGVNGTLNASSHEDFIAMMRSQLEKAGARFYVSYGQDKKIGKKHASLIRPERKKATHYQLSLNHGWGNRGVNAARQGYAGYRTEVFKIPIDSVLPAWAVKPDFVHEEVLGDGYYFYYPLTKYIHIREEVPAGVGSYPADTGKYTAGSVSVRIGSIIIAWNVITHFYPFPESVSHEWEKLPSTYISRVAECHSEAEFKELLEEFTVEFRDAHAWVFKRAPRDSQPFFAPPLRLDEIEGRVLVTNVDPSISNLVRIGAEVTEIDGVASRIFIGRKRKRVSGATDQYIYHTLMKELLCRNKYDTVRLKLKDVSREVRLACNHDIYLKAILPVKPGPFLEFEKDLFYVDLIAISDSAAFSLMPQLKRAKGLVFDLRGYPRGNFLWDSLPSYLIRDTIYGAVFKVPVFYHPNQVPVNGYDLPERFKRAPSYKGLTGNVIFITDGTMVSAAESITALLAYNKLGTFVGEATAGTNGNVNSFNMFGIYHINFTGMQVMNSHGGLLHGVGIEPDILIGRSYEAMKAGKDELILGAMEIAKQRARR